MNDDRNRFDPRNLEHLKRALLATGAWGYDLTSDFRDEGWRVRICRYPGELVYEGPRHPSLSVAAMRGARWFLQGEQAAAVRAALGEW